MEITGRVRAIVTDLDGTIVRADGTISAATASTMAQLRRAGIPVIPATARTPAGLAVLWPATPHIAHAVCCNGSLGYAFAQGQILWQDFIDSTTVEAIVHALASGMRDAGFGVYDGQQWTLTESYFTARGRWPTGRRSLAAPKDIAGLKACAVAVCHPQFGAAQIAAFLRAAGVGEQQAYLSHADVRLLDIAPPGVDKGMGAARILDWLSIRKSQAVGFGDGLNDLPMFRQLGFSVAVANAHEDVIATADLVTESVAEDGFSHALHELGIAD